jgi:hypothetical protein
VALTPGPAVETLSVQRLRESARQIGLAKGDNDHTSLVANIQASCILPAYYFS